MSKKIKLITVDDNNQFLNGIAALLENESNITILSEFTSGVELLENIHLYRPDIILLDIEMPELDGFETAIRVNYFNSKIKLIATTMYQDKVYLQKLIQYGFKAYVSKTKVPEDLIRTIYDVENNIYVFPSECKR